MARRLTHLDSKLANAGMTAPVRFVGKTDTAIDENGNFVKCPQAGTCALCGESLRYVFHFVDACGVTFDAGSNCARHAQLSEDEIKDVMRAARGLATLAKAELRDPGHIARKAAELAEIAAKRLAGIEAAQGKVASLTARKEKLTARLLTETDGEVIEMLNTVLPRLVEDIEHASRELTYYREQYGK